MCLQFVKKKTGNLIIDWQYVCVCVCSAFVNRLCLTVCNLVSFDITQKADRPIGMTEYATTEQQVTIIREEKKQNRRTDTRVGNVDLVS